MAVSSTTINGPIYLPNLSSPKDAKIVFELSSWDREEGEATFVSGPFVGPIDEEGNFSVTLFTTTEGENKAVYQVSVIYLTVTGEFTREFLGVISLAGPGPFKLADVDFVDPMTTASFDLLAEVSAYNLQAETNADLSQVYAENAETAKNLAELAADVVSSYGGTGVSLARVNAAGNDTEAVNAITLLANGARYYPVPFATIQGATNATVFGDVIHITPGVYTESFALKGGRTYQCDPGVVLADCVLTYDGDTSEGPLNWLGHAEVIRTTETARSFNIDDGRNCVLDLFGGVHDENYAATSNMIDWNRTNLHLRTGNCSTVARTLFSADDQWNDQTMLGKSVLEAWNVESKYATRNTASTIYIPIKADRGTTLDVYVNGIKTAANEALGIGSLADPGVAKKTAINFKRGRIDTPNQAALFYSSGVDSGSDYVLTLLNGVVVNSGASPMTRKQGVATNSRVEVHGVVTASSGPDSAVTGPTKGILQIEEAL